MLSPRLCTEASCGAVQFLNGAASGPILSGVSILGRNHFSYNQGIVSPSVQGARAQNASLMGRRLQPIGEARLRGWQATLAGAAPSD